VGWSSSEPGVVRLLVSRMRVAPSPAGTSEQMADAGAFRFGPADTPRARRLEQLWSASILARTDELGLWRLLVHYRALAVGCARSGSCFRPCERLGQMGAMADLAVRRRACMDVGDGTLDRCS